MTAFREYVCWHEDAVLATTPRDAASLGPGHFQAVHHPLPLRRRRLGAREGGRWVPETEIVRALKGPLRPDGYVFVPIVGGAGTGKSHLVRWVRDRTQDVPGWERRYLAKNRTSIRRVIETVIEGLSGKAIDDAREALMTAPAQVEEEDVLAERLLDELALLVSHLDEMVGPNVADPKQRQIRDKLQRQLPDVLRDPVVRRKLVAPGAVIPRLVGLALHGRRDRDGLDDSATRVLETDLPLTFVEVSDASKGARDLLSQMATLPELQRSAVQVVNEALPSAVKRVFVSGQIDFVDVFREVRRDLYAQDKELVLFIEDLTVIHGVEREFLDAIVEPAISPDGRLCNLRIIFAVTEGRFDDLDTVQQRCDDAYWLEIPYGEDGINQEQAATFLGRYLNASRIAPASIETAWQDGHGRRPTENACAGCQFQEACHEGFGRSTDGFGLYPFNVMAIGRLVDVLSREKERFDPREVVREMVNRVLLQGRRELDGGIFPSDALLEPFDSGSEPLPPLVGAELRTRRPADHEKVANTLRYWSEPASPLKVGEVVLSAFGIDELDLSDPALTALVGGMPLERPTLSAPAVTPGRPTFAHQLKGPSQSLLAQLENWAGQGRDFSATATNVLRNLIHKAIVQNLEVGPTAVHLGSEFDSRRFVPERYIAIEGTVTKQRLDNATILIDRSEVNAAALQGLVVLNELDSEDYPQAAYFRRLVGQATERWTREVTDRLWSAPDEGTRSAVAGLVLCAMIAGNCDEVKATSDYLAAMFAPGARYGPIDGLDRTDKWRALVDQAATMASRLRRTVETEFGESRGSQGDVRAVQAHRLLEVVNSFTSEWSLETEDASIAPLMRAVAPAVSVEWGQLCERARYCERLVERERPWADQTGKVLAVLGAAHDAGRLSDAAALDFLRAVAARTPERAQRSVFRAAELATQVLPLQEQLRVVAGKLPVDVGLVYAFAVRSSSALDRVEADLTERRPADPGGQGVASLVDEVLASTARFARDVKDLAK